MSRVWKDVCGFENLYEISNDKIVRNKETLYELSQFKRNGRGSPYVGLTRNGSTRSMRVDTLHYKAFGESETVKSKYNDEIWIDIKRYEGVYQISNYGKIRSLDRYIEQLNSDGYPYNRFIKGRELSLNRTNGNGYRIVMLGNGYRNQPKNNEYIHILVAKHFIPNQENKPTVNHIDGDKTNNHVSNLEWATQQEQMKHAFENNLNNIIEYASGKQLKGSECTQARLTELQAKEIYKLANSSKYTDKQIGNLYGVSRKTVNQIKNKQTWKHIHETA